MNFTQTRWSIFWLWLAVTVIHLPSLTGGVYFLDVYLTEVHPHMAALGRALSHGELPFWEPGIMLGYPLASNPQAGIFYLPHLLGSLLIDAHVLMSLSAYLHCLLAAIGTFVLARHHKMSHAAAVLAGIVYACSPFIVYYHQAIHGLIALAYLPWIVWLSWTAAEGESLRRWAMGAILLALQMYAGHLQFVLYTVVLAAMAAVFGVQHNTRRARLKVAGMTVAQSALALLLYAPQLLAAYVLWRNSLRSTLSVTDMASTMNVEALGLDDLVELVSPNFFGGPSLHDFWYPEFIGAATLLLAFVAIKNRNEYARFWTLVWAIAVAYLCIVRIPAASELLASIPVLNAFRAPGRILCWVLIAVALLAGRGFDLWSERKYPAWVTVIACLLLALAGSVVAGLFDSVPGRDSALSLERLAELKRLDAWLIVGALVTMGSATYLLSRHARLATTLMLLSAVLPVLWVAQHYNPVVDELPRSPAVALIKQQQSGARVFGVSAGDPNYMASVPGAAGWPHGESGDPQKAGWSLVSNVALAHGLKNLHAQSSLPLHHFVTRLYGSGLGALQYPFQEQPHIDAALLRHVHVSHVVSAKGGQMPVQPRPRALSTRSGYTVYELGRLPGRARFYPQASIVEHGNNGWEHIPPGSVTAADVSVDERGHLIANFVAKTKGVLFVSESYYPGWQARVDGKIVEVVKVDGAFVGVEVGPGKHRVELRYFPIYFFRGIPLLGMGFALLVLIFWLTRGRQSEALRTDPR